MYKGYILRIGQLRLDEAEEGGYISPVHIRSLQIKKKLTTGQITTTSGT